MPAFDAAEFELVVDSFEELADRFGAR